MTAVIPTGLAPTAGPPIRVADGEVGLRLIGAPVLVALNLILAGEIAALLPDML